MGSMLPYIAAPWIRHGYGFMIFMVQLRKTGTCSPTSTGLSPFSQIFPSVSSSHFEVAPEHPISRHWQNRSICHQKNKYVISCHIPAVPDDCRARKCGAASTVAVHALRRATTRRSSVHRGNPPWDALDGTWRIIRCFFFLVCVVLKP